MKTEAAAGINKQINFQGKMTDANGLNVADGTYQFVFRLYTVSSGGVAAWTETVNLSVNDGIFQHALGSTTALPGSVDFNSDNIFLGITFNSDPAGEMTPRIQLTASPYAFNSDQLDGLDASDFVQLNPSVAQTGDIAITGDVEAGSGTITGDLTVDTNTLFVDAANNRVGFGTTSNTQAGVLISLAAPDTTSGSVLGINGTLSSTTNNLYGVGIQPTVNVDSNSDLDFVGVISAPSTATANLDTGTAGLFAYAAAPIYTGSNTIRNLVGYSAVVYNASSGTVTNGRGIEIANPINNGTITTNTGIWLSNQTAGVTDYGIYIGGADTYALFVDAGATRLDGTLAVGDTVTIGASDTTGTLLTLDTKTDAGDPTGVQGGMYYNSNANKFRCYEAATGSGSGGWKDCIGSGSSGDILNGGQDGAIIIGTNDATSLTFETSNQSAMTIASGGATTFQNASNSTDGFRVNNSSGDAVLKIDTANNRTAINVPSWMSLDYSLQAQGYADDTQGIGMLYSNYLSGSTSIGQTGAHYVTSIGDPLSSNFNQYSSLSSQINTTATANTIDSRYTALQTSSYIDGVGSINELTGAFIDMGVTDAASAGIIRGIDTSLGNSGTGTVSTLSGINVRNAYNSGGGTISNQYGIRIENLTSGTNNYGLYIQGATNYALWVESGESRLNGQLTIGESDTTGTLLVLDTKTDTGDPTGVNGGMYYNSNAGKFRCYENSTWKDCISGGGGGSLFTDAGAATYLTSLTDNLTVGYNGDLGFKLAIVNDDSAQPAIGIALASGQTAPILSVYNASATELFSINARDQYSVFLGFNAGASDDGTDNGNIGIGHRTLQSVTTGDGNVAIGSTALQNGTGGSNIAIGGGAQSGADGWFNVGVGQNTLSGALGDENSALGHRALESASDAYGNNAFGNLALSSVTDGDYNIAIGYQAGDNITTGSQNIIIGHAIDAASATGSNQLNIAGLLTSSNYTTGGQWNGTLTVTGATTLSASGAASTPAQYLSGSWFTGGTATTTKPQLLVQPSAATSNNWSTSGTGIGVNAASGFAGNLLDLQINGTRALRVGSDGYIYFADAGDCNGSCIGDGGTGTLSVRGGFGLELSAANGGNVILGADAGASVVFSGMTTDITTGTNENWTVSPNGTGDITFTLDDGTNFQLSGTRTNSGGHQTIAVTLGNDTGADMVSGLQITATSAATGDTDTLMGLHINDLASPQAVSEYGILIGSGWDANLFFNDSTAQIQVVDSGVITFEDALGNDLLTVTDGGTVGNIGITGNLTANGNTTLGDATSDTITFTGRVNSHLLPSTNDTYDLGSDSFRWRDLYLGGETMHIGTSITDEATISYNTSTDSLILKNATNSTSALQIQNSSGASLLTADTSSMQINLGTLGGAGASLNINGPIQGSTASWVGRTAAEANNWTGIAYGNGTFVAVATSGTNQVMTSPDGITWTARTAVASNWTSVTYGNGLFVAVANGGTNRVMTSPDGITWTARTASQANIWMSVTYGNSLFVAVSADGTNQVMTSPDGITWTARNATEANQWYDVTYGGGMFVAVSINGTNRVMTSPDGITWTARNATEVNLWTSVTYGNGTFVAISYDGTNRVMTSPDGITWTARTAAEANNWISIAYGNGLFAVVSGNGTYRVMTSGGYGTALTVRGNLELQGNLTIAGSGGLNIGTVDSNAQLLVLDTKNTSGDPTGTNGGMYYNSNSGKFRCYQNNAWSDCVVDASLLSTSSSGGGSVSLLGSNSGDISPWVGTSSLSGAYSELTTVISNGYIYALGGTAGGAQSTVYMAKIGSNGTLGTWTAATSLPAARYRHMSVTAGGYIYVIGGVSASTVYYSMINSDGTLGAWKSASSTLARSWAAATVANGYIYVIGSDNSGNPAATVSYARINTDGSLGSWTTASNPLPANRSKLTAVAANGYIYAIGGDNGSAAQSTVYYAQLNSNGSIGSWTTASNPLSSGRYSHSSVVANGYLYVIGGYTGSGYLSTTSYAKLNSDGSLGTWTDSANPIGAGAAFGASATANGYIYYLGSGASTVRYTRAGGVVSVGGSLGSTGGSITAGNIKAVGSLEIQGQSSFRQMVSMTGGLNISVSNANSGDSNITLQAIDDVNEGGQITLNGGGNAGSPWPSHNIDVYQGAFRVHSQGQSNLSIDSTTGNTTVRGTFSVGALSGATGNHLCYGVANVLSTCTSSRTAKHDIQNSSYGLEELRQLQSVSFAWNEDGRKDIGFIAEEVAQIIPETTQYNSDGSVKSFNYDPIVSVLTRSVQQLDVQVQENDVRLAVLEEVTANLSPDFSGYASAASVQTLGTSLSNRIMTLEQGIFATITVSGPATFQSTLTVTGDTFVQNITVAGKFITAGAVPASAVMGSYTQDDATIAITGNDTAGEVSFTTTSGASVALGQQFKVTFTSPFGTKPRVNLTPTTAASAATRFYTEQAEDGFTVFFVDPPETGKNYGFNYFVVQ